MNWSEIFRYDESSGLLHWVSNTGRRTSVAGDAGSKYCKKGKPIYISVQLNGKRIMAHRIIWEMHNGSIPEGMQIDHKNCNPFDNRLSNLRLATRSENARNKRISRNSTSGFKGVHRYRRTSKWMAVIQADGKKTYVGVFKSKELAYAAYCEAATSLHGEFARLK